MTDETASHTAEIGGCDCTELCSMGPTCPGAILAGLDGSGCWRTEPTVGVQHVLLGNVCLCGDWSAGCGNDVPEQWRQHVNAAERASATSPASTPEEGTS